MHGFQIFCAKINPSFNFICQQTAWNILACVCVCVYACVHVTRMNWILSILYQCINFRITFSLCPLLIQKSSHDIYIRWNWNVFACRSKSRQSNPAWSPYSGSFPIFSLYCALFSIPAFGCYHLPSPPHSQASNSGILLPLPQCLFSYPVYLIFKIQEKCRMPWGISLSYFSGQKVFPSQTFAPMDSTHGAKVNCFTFFLHCYSLWNKNHIFITASNM